MNKRLIALALVAVALLGACGGGDDTDTATGNDEAAATTPPPSGDITYFATEYAYAGPDTIGAGQTTFTLVNKGEQDHMMVLVELLEGKTIDDVTTYLEEHGEQGKPPSWVRDLHFDVFAKTGEEASGKPVDLTPGTYAILCFVPDKETHKPHALLGMTKEITVQ